MSAIISFFQSYGLNIQELLITAAVFLVGSILLSTAGRFVFGKKSTISVASSSAIGILFIYLAFVLLNLAGPGFSFLLAPLPFISIEGETLYFSVLQGNYAFISSQLLSMIILSFLVNLADRWLPKGKSLRAFLLTLLCLAVGAAGGFVIGKKKQ